MTTESFSASIAGLCANMYPAIEIAATPTTATGAQSFQPILASREAPVAPEPVVAEWLDSNCAAAAEPDAARAEPLPAAPTTRDCDEAGISPDAARTRREESVWRLSRFRSLRTSAALW